MKSNNTWCDSQQCKDYALALKHIAVYVKHNETNFKMHTFRTKCKIHLQKCFEKHPAP